MIDTARLKGEIAAHGYSQSSLAAEMGIAENTFYDKMKRGVFNSNEIESMIRLLKLQDPVAIFFANAVAR